MEIDPRFKAARKSAARRRVRSTYGPVLLWGGSAAVAIGFCLAIWTGGIFTGTLGEVGHDDEGAYDHGTEEADAGAQYTSPFIDLAGDPMLLRFDASAVGAEKSRALLRPPGLAATRVGAELVLLTDELVTGQERLITTLPSSREDFAFFQAQRAMPSTPAPAPVESAAPALSPEAVAVGASWGENLDGSVDTSGDFIRTKVEDTTSLAFVSAEASRKPDTEDVVLRLKEAGTLADLMVANGLDPAASARFAESAATILPEAATLNAGHILAVRGALQGGVRVPVQMSLYTRNTYLGSVAVSDAGAVVAGADPWVAEDLFAFAGDDAPVDADVGRKFRLLDAFYSGAIRNGVPSAIVGETIVLMSQAHDLEAFASPGDRMTLLYSKEGGSDGPGPGQVLYAAIRGTGRLLECYVLADAGGTFACVNTTGTARAGDGVGLRDGLVTPVQGVLTSRYGPRMHPILKVAKLHRGVDWAAPVGTPITAAFDGTVRSAGDGQGYGNLVILGHADGMETRYAHMNAFAEGLRAGLTVKAGDVIGFVGTTGLSTGPHLHFEMYLNGESVDPLSSASDPLAGSAVEQLTDRIIRVESAGVATAKNPLSTATGLGQFIEGTWLRMMTAYRPDLASTLTREALLALRTDPTISREMVANLAREGEAYLRARGHSITAGRLYLCHFLGADGADRVLKSTDDQMLVDVLGAGVVNANPFLTGKTVAFVKDWAERKMTGGPAAPAAVVVPPEVLAYRDVIAALIEEPT